MVEGKMERIIVGAMTRRKLSYQKLAEKYEKINGKKISKQALNQKVKKLYRTKNKADFIDLLLLIGVSEENIKKYVREVE